MTSKRKPHGNGTNPNWEYGATQRQLYLLNRRSELPMREQVLGLGAKGRIRLKGEAKAKPKAKAKVKTGPLMDLEALFK